MPMIHKFTLSSLDAAPYDLEADKILDGDPQPAVSVFWKSEDGSVIAGLFRSTPGKFLVQSRGAESTLVTKGRIRITADDGTSEEFGVGDVMTFQAGTRSIFDVLDDYEDYFVANVPANSE
jgi:uncharacterized cupin superfamily protein